MLSNVPVPSTMLLREGRSRNNCDSEDTIQFHERIRDHRNTAEEVVTKSNSSNHGVVGDGQLNTITERVGTNRDSLEIITVYTL